MSLFPYILPIDFFGPVGDLGNLAWIRQLMPRGRLWLLEQTSKLAQTLLVIADEADRVRERVGAMISEGDPRSAVETLAEWEAVVGLPDEAVPVISSDPAQRQVAIAQKLAAHGGQTPAYYVQLAAACGYTVTVTDNYASLVLRSGFRCGARCYGDDWAFVWLVTVTATASTALSHTQLEAVITKVAPAHTEVIFAYP